MKNYQKQDIGKLNELDQYVIALEGLPKIEGKLFLGERLGLTSMEVSLNKDAPGKDVNFFHRHRNNEELYIFIKGKGEMLIDDERFEVEEGTVVRVQQEAKRAWWNSGAEDLYYIVIQAQAGGLKAPPLEDVEILDGAIPWT